MSNSFRAGCFSCLEGLVGLVDCCIQIKVISPLVMKQGAKPPQSIWKRPWSQTKKEAVSAKMNELIANIILSCIVSTQKKMCFAELCSLKQLFRQLRMSLLHTSCDVPQKVEVCPDIVTIMDHDSWLLPSQKPAPSRYVPNWIFCHASILQGILQNFLFIGSTWHLRNFAQNSHDFQFWGR